MRSRLRASRFKIRLPHLRRQSPLLHHFRVKALLAILLVLLCVIGIHSGVETRRASGEEDDPEVVVGSFLRARLQAEEFPERTELMQVLEDCGVRPTLQQTLVLTCDGEKLEMTASQSVGYSVENRDGELMLINPDGKSLGNLQRVYLPADEDSVRRVTESQSS